MKKRPLITRGLAKEVRADSPSLVPVARMRLAVLQ
jgi:hypothetical protein